MSDRNEWFKDVKRLIRGLEEMYSWMWDEESVVCEQLGLAGVKAEKGGDE